MSEQNDDTEKSHEPTQRKLDEARKKGQVAKSTDVSVAASYAGLLLAMSAAGAASSQNLGRYLAVLLDQPDELAKLVFSGTPTPVFGGIFLSVILASSAWFFWPAVVVFLSLVAQRAIVFAPSKLAMKMSRIDPIANAKNKFGRSGWFEFFKSFVKLTVYSVCLSILLAVQKDDILGAIHAGPRAIAPLLGQLCFVFLLLVLAVSVVISGFDYLWQYHEHRRRNMMSRKELTDEAKDSEGDPHIKQQRRQKSQQIAMSQMMGDVPDADVIIVNPTHFAVALKWSRKRGEAPVCVAKGVDNTAKKIREIAQNSAVPIHSDPLTARAIYASVDVGQEILPDHFKPVAAAIRFAEKMRQKARGSK